jgi:VWFA-related protein
MMKLGIVGALAVLSVVTPAAPQQQPPFVAGTNLVVVPVVVVDRKGQHVSNLTAADFGVTEDGKPVSIELFTAPRAATEGPAEGRFIVVVLDNLRTPAELAFRVKGIAKRFVDRMGPADTMTIIPISKGQALTTTDKAALNAAIDRFAPDFGDNTRTLQQDAEHSLRTIGELSAQMSKAPQRRKVLAIIGNIATFNPQRESAFSDRDPDLGQEWFEAVRETSRYNVSVYAIDALGLREGAYPADYATSFAAETGGWAWGNTNNYGGAVEQIWREAGTYYVLGYNAPINDGKLHTIDVKVNSKGATVRARRGRY